MAQKASIERKFSQPPDEIIKLVLLSESFIQKCLKDGNKYDATVGKWQVVNGNFHSCIYIPLSFRC